MFYDNVLALNIYKKLFSKLEQLKMLYSCI